MDRALALSRDRFVHARRRLCATLFREGIRDQRVLNAIQAVQRHTLVPEALWDQAYRDHPLPIGEGQTISAPGVVARMTEALDLTEDHSVLEIGTGSGYQASILSRLASHVVSIERIPKLAARARSALDQLGVTNVIVHLGDGTQGRSQDAPFDRIVVTAGGPEIPEPLLRQLSVEGVLVGPFGPRGSQELTRIRRVGPGRFTREVLGACRFVDLVGQHGWAS